MPMQYDVIPSKPRPRPLWPFFIFGLLAYLVCLQVAYPRPAPTSGPGFHSDTQTLAYSRGEVQVNGLSVGGSGVEARKLPQFVNSSSLSFFDQGNRVRMVRGSELTLPAGKCQAGQSRAQLLETMKAPPYPKSNGPSLSWRGPDYMVRVFLTGDQVDGFQLQEVQNFKP